MKKKKAQPWNLIESLQSLHLDVTEYGTQAFLCQMLPSYCIICQSLENVSDEFAIISDQA